MASRIFAWSSVKSTSLCPDTVYTARRWFGFTDASMNRNPATFVRDKSPTSRCASSKSKATNREGICSAPDGDATGLPAGSVAEPEIANDAESVGSGIASPRATSFSAVPAVTTEKCVINCSFPSCLIWKSSFCRFSTAWPDASCTTTRTGTRFACDSSGTGEVLVLISGVDAIVAETGTAEAAVVDDGEADGGSGDGAPADVCTPLGDCAALPVVSPLTVAAAAGVVAGCAADCGGGAEEEFDCPAAAC